MLASSSFSPDAIKPLYAFGILLVLFSVRLVYNYTRLSHIPGPLLASVTDVWRFCHQNSRVGLRKPLLRLHQQYGPVVRYGVRSVSLATPEALSQIYGSRAGFVTAPSYKVLVGISNGKEVPSLVSTADETRHGELRRSVASYFTPTGVSVLEGRIEDTIRDFHSVLRSKVGEAFDLAKWMLFFTMDSAAHQAFSESRGYLDAGKDVDGSIALIRARFIHWGRWASLPNVESLIYRNPISMRRKQTPSSMAAAAVQKLQARTSGAQPDSKLNDLLQSFIHASQTHPNLIDTTGIVGLLMSTISGAGDTTASTITATVYFLLTHPHDLATLRNELQSNGIPLIPRYEQTSKLPFLHAVIRESMRCFSTVTFPIERVVPPPSLTISEHVIPSGTTVGVLPPALHMDTNTFGSDAQLFRPQRWIEANEQQYKLMEATHMGFSKGRRVCLGQNIAMMQMKKVIPMIVMGFDMKLVHPHGDGELASLSEKADFSFATVCLEDVSVRITGVRKEVSGK